MAQRRWARVAVRTVEQLRPAASSEGAIVGGSRSRLHGVRVLGFHGVSLPVALLLGAAITSGVLLIVLQSHLTFLIDDWDLLLQRRGFSANVFLEPHNEHIIVAPTIVYKAIQATFGMHSIVPFAVAATAVFVASAVLLFAFLRRRIGEWLALAAAVLILFMGSAYEDLLSPFQIGYFGSVACGIGALLLLERRARRRDAVACGLLVGSTLFSSVGLPFIAGAAIAIALDSQTRRRAYVVAVPIFLYLLWYLGWGHTGNTQLSFDNLATSPSYILDGFASSLASLFGLDLATGRALLVALVFVAALRLRTLRSTPRGLWVAIAIAVSFWFLIAFDASLGRPPTASRYQYLGAVFIFMTAAELARGVRPGRRALIAVFAVVGAASLSNMSTLHRAYEGLDNEGDIVRADLSALEIAADTVRPGFELTPGNSDFNYFGFVDAGSYLSAAMKFGSPAYTPSELAAASEPARVAADKVLAGALPATFEPVSRLPSPDGPAPLLVGPAAPRATASGGCLDVRPSGGANAVVSLPPGGAMLRASSGATAQVRARRYASESFPVAVGALRGAAILDIPEDRASEPWELELDSPRPVRVCGRSAG